MTTWLTSSAGRWILAREAGDILARYFGGNLDIQYKDDRRNDPVTNADREVQDFLVNGR